MSAAITHQVEYQGNLRGKRLLELGAGTGALGLAAACQGTRVVLSDLPTVIPLLETNIRLNVDAVTAGGGEVTAVSPPRPSYLQSSNARLPIVSWREQIRPTLRNLLTLS